MAKELHKQLKELDSAQRWLKETVRRRIRELRLANGMTQSELGERIGSAKPHISELENGKTYPGIGMVAKLAYVLKVEPAELLREGR
jgi:transcriptional regulator with XRE-family HTH domain